MKLTQSAITKLKPPVPTPPATRAQIFYRDDTLKGFALRMTSDGAKSFIVEKWMNGRARRFTLGSYGELTVEQARREAQKLLGKIATGIDPTASAKEEKAKRVTLAEVFADYLKARKALKPKTLQDYTRCMEVAFKDWRNKPLRDITKDLVQKRHSKLGEERGEAYANLSMRVLRALFNFAAGQYENSQGHSLFPENPVKRLSQSRAWYRVERRQSVIKAHELAAWFDAVLHLKNDAGSAKAEITRDYLLLVLLTGLRREEAAKLTWADVDLKAQTLTIRDTKNRQPHTLPLSDFLLDLLIHRQQASLGRYVFPGQGASGHIFDPRKQMALVITASGVTFTIHDLRRTFATIAESLDIPAYALKRLLNHKMTSDVTAGYIIADVERLRRPMQQITDFILRAAGIKETAKVIALDGMNGGGAAK